MTLLENEQRRLGNRPSMVNTNLSDNGSLKTCVPGRHVKLFRPPSNTCSASIFHYLYFPQRGNINVVPARIHSQAGLALRVTSHCDITCYIHLPVGEGGCERVGEANSIRLVDSLEISWKSLVIFSWTRTVCNVVSSPWARIQFMGSNEMKVALQ